VLIARSTHIWFVLHEYVIKQQKAVMLLNNEEEKKKISHRQIGPLAGIPFRHIEPARVKPN